MPRSTSISFVMNGIIIHDIIAEAQAEAGHAEDALALLTNVKDATEAGYAKSSIALRYSKQNDIVAALRVADSITDTSWHVLTLQNIVEDLIHRNQLSQVSKIIAQEQSLAPGVSEASSQGIAYLAIADHQEAVKQHKEALATLEFVQPLLVNLPQAEQPAYLWWRLASTQMRLGHLEAALQTVRMLKSLTTRGWVLRRIAFARVHTDEVNVLLRWCDSLSTVYEQTEALIGTANGLLNTKNSQQVKK